MKLDLDKNDLISLVVGTEPCYSVFENENVKNCGEYKGGFNGEWKWNTYALKELSEESLYELYTICKKSWL